MNSATEKSIEFGGERIGFTLERTARRKTVAISVGHEGVRVLAPADLDDERILCIVRKRGPWLLRKIVAYAELGGSPVTREYVGGETFHYLGRPYRLRVITDENAVSTRIRLRGTWLEAPVLPNSAPIIRRSAIRSGMRQWYSQRAKKLFPERAGIVAEMLGIDKPSVQVVEQSKRWGSCDSKGRIRLNWRLVMAPLPLVDYVIAHEACHILEHNHSRQFWRKLETVMPDYEARVRQLDRLGHLFVS